MAKTATELLSAVQDAIYAILNGGAVKSYEVGGKRLDKYTLTELQALEKKYQAQVSNQTTYGKRNLARFDSI